MTSPTSFLGSPTCVSRSTEHTFVSSTSTNFETRWQTLHRRDKMGLVGPRVLWTTRDGADSHTGVALRSLQACVSLLLRFPPVNIKGLVYRTSPYVSRPFQVRPNVHPSQNAPHPPDLLQSHCFGARNSSTGYQSELQKRRG